MVHRSFRILKVTCVPCRFHGLADGVEIAHCLSHRDQQVPCLPKLRQMDNGIGEGIGPFLRIVQPVAQHQRTGSFRRAAHKDSAAAHLGK